MTRTGDGDQIEHGERWAAMTPEQKQALEAQRQAAESDLKHLLPRAEPIEDRLERAKIMTPEQWRSLEQMFSLSHVLERHYKECWPAGKSKLKRVVKAISEIWHSPTWIELDREDREMLKGYAGKRLTKAEGRCALIDSLIIAQGRRMIARDVKAGRRPVAALDSQDAAIIVALNHPYIGVNTKMALRDELRRRDGVLGRIESGDAPARPDDEDSPSVIDAWMPEHWEPEPSAAEDEEHQGVIGALLAQCRAARTVQERMAETGETISAACQALKINRADYYRDQARVLELAREAGFFFEE